MKEGEKTTQILRKYSGCPPPYMNSAPSKYESQVLPRQATCLVGFRKHQEFLDQLTDYKLLKVICSTQPIRVIIHMKAVLTVSAPVKFRPSPPTCVVNSSTSIDGSLLNAVTTSCLIPGEILPSSLRYVTVGMWLLSKYVALTTVTIRIMILKRDAPWFSTELPALQRDMLLPLQVDSRVTVK